MQGTLSLYGESPYIHFHNFRIYEDTVLIKTVYHEQPFKHRSLSLSPLVCKDLYRWAVPRIFSKLTAHQ